MADTSSWSYPAAVFGGHYGGAAAGQPSGVPYFQPPVLSSSLPSYTLTHTFTFPTYIGPSAAQPPVLLNPTPPSSLSSPWQPLPYCERSGLAEPSNPAASLPQPSALTLPATAATSTAASSSLSSAAQPALSAVSTSSSSASDSSTPPSSIRPRLTASERKARRAAKHRAIDLTRRTRESTALAQLKQLVTPTEAAAAPATGPVTASSADIGSRDGRAVDGSASSEAVSPDLTSLSSALSAATDSKASVLEQTVAEVLRLRALILAQQALLDTRAALTLPRPVVPPLPHSLSPEWPALYNHHITHHSPPPTRYTPAAAANCTSAPGSCTLTSLSCDLHTLYSSFFLHSPYHLTLIQPGTAACLDSNASFLSHARLPRASVVGKRITLCPAVRLLLDRGERIVADEFMGGQAVDCGRERQAANGMSLFRLYSGADSTVLCRFRYVLGEARVMDVTCRCWLTRGHFSGVTGDMPLMIAQSCEDDYSSCAA